MTPFLLIPGLNCTGEVFAGTVAALWRWGPVTIANHCEGDSMEAMARAILETAPPRFALAGFSMGGYVAFEILRMARERVSKLALIDTMARGDTDEDFERRDRSIAAAQSGRFRDMLLSHMPQGGTDVKEARIRMAETIGAERYVIQQKAIRARRDARADLALIDVPTIVIVGEKDEVTPPDAAREMAAAINGAKYVEIGDASHFALLENPEAVSAALVDWART